MVEAQEALSQKASVGSCWFSISKKHQISISASKSSPLFLPAGPGCESSGESNHTRCVIGFTSQRGPVPSQGHPLCRSLALRISVNKDLINADAQDMHRHPHPLYSKMKDERSLKKERALRPLAILTEVHLITWYSFTVKLQKPIFASFSAHFPALTDCDVALGHRSALDVEQDSPLLQLRHV